MQVTYKRPVLNTAAIAILRFRAIFSLHTAYTGNSRMVKSDAMLINDAARIDFLVEMHWPGMVGSSSFLLGTQAKMKQNNNAV